jgi:hypothetical protein
MQKVLEEAYEVYEGSDIQPFSKTLMLHVISLVVSM